MRNGRRSGIIGATVVSALGSTSPAHGFPEQDDKRKALNEFIRASGTFDGVDRFRQARRSIRPRAASSRSSSPKAPPAAPATSFIPTAPDIWRWDRLIDLDLFKPGKIGRSAQQ